MQRKSEVIDTEKEQGKEPGLELVSNDKEQEKETGLEMVSNDVRTKCTDIIPSNKETTKKMNLVQINHVQEFLIFLKNS